MLVALLGLQPALGQGAPVFRVKQAGLVLRAAPSLLASAGAGVTQGDVFDIIGRSDDNAWLALKSGARNGWLPAGFGDVEGSLASVGAYRRADVKIAKNGSNAALPAWVRVTPRGRSMVQQSAKLGRDPRMFAIAGDSNSAWPRHQGRMLAGPIDRTPFAAYPYVLSRFDPAFARVSVAVGGGFRAADMFLPERANPACLPAEAMFACELRQTRAAIVFIQLGTGDKFVWREFEPNLRKMIDHALASNVAPVFMTKADDLESIQGGAGENHINDVIRRLAAEYQLPLIDWHAASRSQPVIENPELPKRPFIKNGLHDEWGYYFHLTDEAFALRMLATVQMLDALTR